MTAAWMLLLLSTVPQNDVNVITDRVDHIEYNHVYDQEGKHVFDQAIFWRWNAAERASEVVAWRQIKPCDQVPIRDQARQRYVTMFHDGTFLRRVEAGAFQETWTQFDPELANRAQCDKGNRRGLFKPCVAR